MVHDWQHPTAVDPTKVTRRVARLNKARMADNPLWATGGEAVLSQVAGEPISEAQESERLWRERRDRELSWAKHNVERGYRAYLYRERLRPFFTPMAFARLDEKRRIYPLDPVYAVEYWRNLCRECGLEAR